jgi:hypothetical protein
MFRTLYLVRIKASIFNKSKIFDSLFSNDSRLSLFSHCSNILVNPLPTSVYSTYKPLILDGFLKFWCFSLDLARTNSKTPSFFPYGCCKVLVRRGVFILHNFSYLYLGPISFKCIIFAPTSFSSYN